MNESKYIEGYEGLYSIDKSGNVYSHKHKKYLAHGDVLGHSVVNLYKNKTIKMVYVHRLVAQAFIPNPNNCPVVHHIDGNGRNNCVDNLKWCTQKENVAHCIESGNFGKMPYGCKAYKNEGKKKKGIVE